MSFDLFLQCIQLDASWTLSRSQIRCLFPVVEPSSDRSVWTVEYGPMNRCTLALTSLPADPDSIVAIHIERPCADERFWQAVLSILKFGPIALLFPGGPPVVGTPEALSALSKDTAAPDPVPVQSVGELLDIIRRS